MLVRVVEDVHILQVNTQSQEINSFSILSRTPEDGINLISLRIRKDLVESLFEIENLFWENCQGRQLVLPTIFFHLAVTYNARFNF